MKNTCKAVGVALLPAGQTTGIIHAKKKHLFCFPLFFACTLYSYNNNHATQKKHTHGPPRCTCHPQRGGDPVRAVHVRLAPCPNHMLTNPSFLFFSFLYFWRNAKKLAMTTHTHKAHTRRMFVQWNAKNVVRSNCSFFLLLFFSLMRSEDC